VIAALDRAGAMLLSNEGRRIGRGGRILLLGLNQQVGYDTWGFAWRSPFRTVRWKGEHFYGGYRKTAFRNFYSHWDPAPLGITDESGPLAWSGYDVVCDTLIDGKDTGTGLVVHSRFVLGEDRMYSLARGRGRGLPGTFSLWARGTVLAGDLDTGVAPEPGRWYRMRVRTEVAEEVVRVLARVWRADRPEPREWQARGEDRSRHRVTAGTAGLWTWGGGTVVYRNLRVTKGGEALLTAPLAGRNKPHGFREGARGTRLALALARSPHVPQGIPTVVLSHTPAVVLEASRRGMDAVLAGHTHGGQVRLPFLGALTTRDSLGAHYDYGRYHFPSPTPRGLTTLYINAGVGTSVLPVRFWCPPRFAVVELGNPRDTKDSEHVLDVLLVLSGLLLTTSPAPPSYSRTCTTLKGRFAMDRWLVVLILGQFVFVGFIIWVAARAREASLRQRSEERNRLLERFSSSQELTAFLNSEAGARLLKTHKGPDHPTRKIAVAVFAGVITLFVGLGFLVVVSQGWDPSGGRLIVPGTICVTVGIGILIAAGISSWLFSRAGLMSGPEQ
jgi:hypothetical protein